MNEKIEIQTLFQPKKLWGYLEISANKNIIPETPGIYAWYFRNFPAEIPTDNCIVDMGLTLLYLGIVPRNSFSSQTLRDRIHRHLTGNAEGSTLRLSLGCILDDELNIQLRRVGSGKSKTFAEGEKYLSEWMATNAFVTWLELERPWEIEKKIIQEISPPLNLKFNQPSPYYAILSGKRKAAKKLAKELPIV